MVMTILIQEQKVRNENDTFDKLGTILKYGAKVRTNMVTKPFIIYHNYFIRGWAKKILILHIWH